MKTNTLRILLYCLATSIIKGMDNHHTIAIPKPRSATKPVKNTEEQNSTNCAPNDSSPDTILDNDLPYTVKQEDKARESQEVIVIVQDLLNKLSLVFVRSEWGRKTLCPGNIMPNNYIFEQVAHPQMLTFPIPQPSMTIDTLDRDFHNQHCNRRQFYKKRQFLSDEIVQQARSNDTIIPDDCITDLKTKTNQNLAHNAGNVETLVKILAIFPGLLLEKDNYGNMPLQYYAKRNHPGLLNTAIDFVRSKYPTQLQNFLNHQNNIGQTALHMNELNTYDPKKRTLRSLQNECRELLLRAGIDPTIRTYLVTRDGLTRVTADEMREQREKAEQCQKNY